MLHRGSNHGWLYNKTEPFFAGMENGYKFLLSKFLKVKWVAWIIVVACVVAAVFTYNRFYQILD